MTLNDYQLLAARTIRQDLTMKQALEHSLFGLCAEVGELLSLYQKSLQGHEVKRENMIRECGDCLWMIAEFCTVNRIDLDQVAQTNIDKLRKRYPDGFDIDKSLHRREGDT